MDASFHFFQENNIIGGLQVEMRTDMDRVRF